MIIRLSQLTDFDTVICTIYDENKRSITKINPYFFIKSNRDDYFCKIKGKLLVHDNLVQYTLKTSIKFDLEILKERLELYACFEDKIVKNRILKIDVVEHFAEKVQDINFFPEISSNETIFRLFSPFASNVRIKFFNMDEITIKPMNYHSEGYWSYSEPKNLHLQLYRYLITLEGKTIETIDPFSLSLTENSSVSAVIDFNQLKKIEDFNNPENICDCVLYETHIRDFTSDPETPFPQRNTYKAFCQKGVTKNDFPVGFDHIQELGVTHVHLLPVQDFNSVDELHGSDYNWGYDPKCYTVPEGSYSTDPRNPLTRVEEFTEMVDTFHKEKIGLILDVVYNHTFEQHNSIFNNTIPDYFYRWNIWGELSNGSGCGNEIATERIFVRKYILDSLKHWMLHYKIDGFRFDLMGLIDRETMFTIEKELETLNKDIILYGEPWTGGDSPLANTQKSLKGFQRNHRIAIFNDELRNGIKGYPDDTSKGFVSGELSWTNNVLGSMLGGFGYEDDLVNIADNPREQIVYSSCHDNLTLFDKLNKSCPKSDWDTIFQMNKLSAFISLLSFGVPFLHSGEEFARSKYQHHNTYNAGDLYNTIKWSLKTKHNDLYRYYRNLLEIRKRHRVFRLSDKNEVLSRVNLIHSINGAFLYSISGKDIDDWKYTIIAVNMTEDDLWFKLPETADNKEWTITVNPFHAGESPLGITQKEVLVGTKSWHLLHI